MNLFSLTSHRHGQQLQLTLKSIFRLWLVVSCISISSLSFAEARFNEKCASSLANAEYITATHNFRDNVRALISAGKPLIETVDGESIINILQVANFGMYAASSVQTHADLYLKLSPSQRKNTEKMLTIVLDGQALPFMMRVSEIIISSSTLIKNQSFLNEARGARVALDAIVSYIRRSCN